LLDKLRRNKGCKGLVEVRIAAGLTYEATAAMMMQL
jgi:hypothetical protein